MAKRLKKGGNIRNLIYLGTEGGNNVSETPLEHAKEMLNNGFDMESIRQKTGWFLNPHDELWRYEISDHDMQINPKITEVANRVLSENIEGLCCPIKQLVKHDKLFKAYPDFEKITICIVNHKLKQDYPNVLLFYNEKRIIINLPTNLDYGNQRNRPLSTAATPDREEFNNEGSTSNKRPSDNRRNPYNVIAHELQHAVQAREAMGAGGIRLPNEERVSRICTIDGTTVGTFQSDICEPDLISSGEVESMDVDVRLLYDNLERKKIKPFSWVKKDLYITVMNEEKFTFYKGGSIPDDPANWIMPDWEIYLYAKKIKEKYPLVWALGGNIRGNQSYKDLEKVLKRGHWVENEREFYGRWRSFVARHKHDFRPAGVIANLKWLVYPNIGKEGAQEVIEEAINKKYPKKMREGGSIQITSVKQFNQMIKEEYLDSWKLEHDNILDINERVASQYLQHLSYNYGINPQEIDWENRDKKSHNHFQMKMYSYQSEYDRNVILDTAPFIYVDDNHKIVESKTKVELLNDEYEVIIKSMKLSSKMKQGGNVDGIYELKIYSVYPSTGRYYNIIDLDSAISEANRVDEDDFDDNYNDMEVVVSEKINKYKFVGNLEDGETIEDYPLEEYFEDSEYYELVEEGEDDKEVFTKTIKGKKSKDQASYENLQEILIEVRSYFTKKYPLYERAGYRGETYYILVPIPKTDKNIELRIADHSYNPSNVSAINYIKTDLFSARIGEKPSGLDVDNLEYGVDYISNKDENSVFVDYYKIKPKNRVATLSVVIFSSENPTKVKFGKSENANVSEIEFDTLDPDNNSQNIINQIESEIDFLLKEYSGAEETYKQGGNILLAPNGNPSNLTPEQYKDENSKYAKGGEAFAFFDKVYDIDKAYKMINSGEYIYEIKSIPTYEIKHRMFNKEYSESLNPDFDRAQGLVIKLKNGNELLIDGNHRMNKAHSIGLKEMKVYYIDNPKTISKFTKKLFKEGGDLVIGGLAKGMSINDIAKHHGVSLNELRIEYIKGISVEKEHTSNLSIAGEIARDHLYEDPKYYTKLQKIEKMADGGVIKCPVGTEVQSVLLSRDNFNLTKARKWIKKHNYTDKKVDKTADYYRFRQEMPSKFQKGSFRTIEFKEGIKAVIGCPVNKMEKGGSVKYKVGDKVSFLRNKSEPVKSATIKVPSNIVDGYQVWVTTHGVVSERYMAPEIKSVKKTKESFAGYKAFKGIAKASEDDFYYTVLFSDLTSYSSKKGVDSKQAAINAINEKVFEKRDKEIDSLINPKYHPESFEKYLIDNDVPENERIPEAWIGNKFIDIDTKQLYIPESAYTLFKHIYKNEIDFSKLDPELSEKVIRFIHSLKFELNDSYQNLTEYLKNQYLYDLSLTNRDEKFTYLFINKYHGYDPDFLPKELIEEASEIYEQIKDCCYNSIFTEEERKENYTIDFEAVKEETNSEKFNKILKSINPSDAQFYEFAIYDGGRPINVRWEITSNGHIPVFFYPEKNFAQVSAMSGPDLTPKEEKELYERIEKGSVQFEKIPKQKYASVGYKREILVKITPKFKQDKSYIKSKLKEFANLLIHGNEGEKWYFKYTKNLPNEQQTKMVDSLISSYESGQLIDKRKLEKMAESFGIFDKNLAKEMAELSVVLIARNIIEENKSKPPVFVYGKIVELYRNQVNLSHRTSESMLLQQYSTPAPIGYLMGVYCSLMDKGLYFEPSAGNGLLTIAGDPQNFIVNEIDKTRRSNLACQNYLKITDQDASLPFSGYSKKFDSILTNPPFGSVEVAVDYSTFPIKSLEQLMALRALDCMKDDGYAAIIIGGHLEYDNEGRIKAGKNRIFFNYLFHFYNVEDVINIDGHSLYSRQGTAFNTRLILINGRKKEPKGYAPLLDESLEAEDNMSKVPVTDFETLWKRVEKLF